MGESFVKTFNHSHFQDHYEVIKDREQKEEGRVRGTARSRPLFAVKVIQLSPGTQILWIWSTKNLANVLALGYLVGPIIGSFLHSVTHPSLSRGSPSPLEVMDKAFYDHIKANRASPAFQSVNNPAPDFYGEKVGASHNQSLLPHSTTPEYTSWWSCDSTLLLRSKLTFRSSH